MSERDKEIFLDVVRAAISESIKITVNGKIDKIDKKLQDHVLGEEKRDKKTDEMYEWWSNLMTTASWTNTIFKYILGTAVAFSTIIVAIYKLKGK